MSRPPASRLDASQVLRHAFDDESGTLRVNTEATVVAGSFEVSVDHQTDSVKIGDGIKTAAISSDNSLKVSSGIVKDYFDYFSATHTALTSTYTYRDGGASGNIVAVVSITYTNDDKKEIQTLEVT
jgi:hypothetical protein